MGREAWASLFVRLLLCKVRVPARLFKRRGDDRCILNPRLIGRAFQIRSLCMSLKSNKNDLYECFILAVDLKPAVRTSSVVA